MIARLAGTNINMAAKNHIVFSLMMGAALGSVSYMQKPPDRRGIDLNIPFFAVVHVVRSK